MLAPHVSTSGSSEGDMSSAGITGNTSDMGGDMSDSDDDSFVGHVADLRATPALA